MPTIHSRVAAAREQLLRAGVDPEEAGLEARLLAQFVLGWTPVRFLADARKADSPDFASRFDALVERRLRREPLAYITRERDFWDLPFEVTPAVLIPRPETEGVVEAALERCSDRDARISIADVCTGSGCLAVVLARERPRARVTATDISEAALEVAARNTLRHQVDDRVQLACTDLLAGVDGPFDLIVSNPPYVAERDRASLQPEVRDYEPALALFGGQDGLAVVPRLLAQAAERLSPGGALIFEFGFGQEAAVVDLINNAGLTLLEIRKDLQAIPRVAVCARSSSQ